MTLTRFRDLNRKQIDGTISDAESAELDALVSAHAKTMFDTCPACRGAFSLAEMPDESILCPHCMTTLTLYTSDLAGHIFHEIDPAIEPKTVFGVFSAGYAVPGTIPCLKCGVVYPQNYQCCPGAFLIALELIKSGTESNRKAALRFLDTNAATLLNSLRGGFRVMFEKQYRKQLVKLADGLACGEELQAALKNAG